MTARKKYMRRDILTALTENGGRITVAREGIVKYLCGVSTPQSIQHIVQKVDADEASVYRTIHLLRKRNLIEEIVFPDGSHRYAIAQDHHHHVICTQCERIAHVPCSSSPEQKNTPSSGFAQITGHSVTFFGLCNTCSS